MTESVYLTHEQLTKLCDFLLESRRDEREMNRITRNAIKRTYVEMFDEPIVANQAYRFYKDWIGRSAFSNLINDRGGCAVDRCLGLLCSDRALREAAGLNPHNFDETECQFLHKLIQIGGTRASLLEWLRIIPNSDMSSLPPQASGQTSSEESSCGLWPSAMG